MFDALHEAGFTKNLYEYIDLTRGELIDLDLFTMEPDEMMIMLKERRRHLTSLEDKIAFQVACYAYIVLVINDRLYRQDFIRRLMLGVSIKTSVFDECTSFLLPQSIAELER